MLGYHSLVDPWSQPPSSRSSTRSSVSSRGSMVSTRTVPVKPKPTRDSKTMKFNPRKKAAPPKIQTTRFDPPPPVGKSTIRYTYQPPPPPAPPSPLIAPQSPIIPQPITYQSPTFVLDTVDYLIKEYQSLAQKVQCNEPVGGETKELTRQCNELTRSLHEITASLAEQKTRIDSLHTMLTRDHREDAAGLSNLVSEVTSLRQRLAKCLSQAETQLHLIEKASLPAQTQKLVQQLTTDVNWLYCTTNCRLSLFATPSQSLKPLSTLEKGARILILYKTTENQEGLWMQTRSATDPESRQWIPLLDSQGNLTISNLSVLSQ
jgi:hypothetical protein